MRILVVSTVIVALTGVVAVPSFSDVNAGQVTDLGPSGGSGTICN